MYSSVTLSEQGDEIHLGIVPEKTVRLHMMNLEITSSCLAW